MFYLQPVTQYQEMSDSWKIWDKNYNLRMVKNKDWKDLWNTGMLMSIMSGNWTIDTSPPGLEQIRYFIRSVTDWKDLYYAWEEWWSEYTLEYMPNITFIQKQQLLHEFQLLKTEANDLNILTNMKI